VEAFLFLTIIGTVVFVVWAIAHQQRKEDEITSSLSAWAQEHGWTYTVRRKELRSRFAGTPFTGGGDVRHVVSGERRGRPVLSFEYRYTVSTGSNPPTSTTHYFQVTAVGLPGRLPRLEVTREHLGHKLLGLIGVHDLRLGEPAFDEMFRVRAEDDEVARRVLHFDLIRWLESDPRAGDAPFRFEGDTLLTWTPKRISADGVPEQADFAIDIVEQVPEDLWYGRG
jgi:hypothetical protein